MSLSSCFALRYALFAGIATTLNVAAQYVCSTLYTGYYELYVAMATGTAVGLLVKYFLDRQWIFHDRSNSIREHSVKFSLYSMTGILTTFIFWGTELAFEMIGKAPYCRYIGATVGLTIGYVTKYHLDRHFVFKGLAE